MSRMLDIAYLSIDTTFLNRVLLALAVGFALGRRSALKGASHSPGPGSTGTSTGSGRPCRAGDGASERTSRTRSEQGADSTNSVATAADTHANLAAQRHHTLTDYPLSVQARLSGTVIPQTALSPASGRVPFVPLPSIIFYTNGVPGLLLEDALRPPIRGLHDADMVPTLSTTSREATLCIRVRFCVVLNASIANPCVSGQAIAYGEQRAQ